MPWSLRQSYTLLSPVYDVVVARAFQNARRKSLQALPGGPGLRVLVDGIGTGLDLPWLPAGNQYVGSDITRAMLRRATTRRSGLDLALVEADSLALPFRDNAFDHAVLHLILAVVPDATACLREAARVVKSGGRLVIFDKFLRPGERAPLRRLVNHLARRIATRTDVVFEEALGLSPALRLLQDEEALAGGWFRRIVLEKI